MPIVLGRCDRGARNPARRQHHGCCQHDDAPLRDSLLSAVLGSSAGYWGPGRGCCWAGSAPSSRPSSVHRKLRLPPVRSPTRAWRAAPSELSVATRHYLRVGGVDLVRLRLVARAALALARARAIRVGPVHWPDRPAPLPPLVGGPGFATAGGTTVAAKASAENTPATSLRIRLASLGV